MGNIVGSNIANLALVMGIAALIYPLATTKSFVRREVPFMIGTSLDAPRVDLSVQAMTGWRGSTGSRASSSSVYLSAMSSSFCAATNRVKSKRWRVSLEEVEDEGIAKPLIFTAVGAALLVAGAQLLVAGAVSLAEAAGVDERIIGITLSCSWDELARTRRQRRSGAQKRG